MKKIIMSLALFLSISCFSSQQYQDFMIGLAIYSGCSLAQKAAKSGQLDIAEYIAKKTLESESDKCPEIIDRLKNVIESDAQANHKQQEIEEALKLTIKKHAANDGRQDVVDFINQPQ